MGINNINGIPGNGAPRTGEGAKAPAGNSDAVTATQQVEAPAATDAVTLTDTAARLRTIENSLAELPEVDEARVAAVRQAITDGSYQADAGKIADKLLAFESDLHG
jgi:negative regulator of flagellin synthesis FlgM